VSIAGRRNGTGVYSQTFPPQIFPSTVRGWVERVLITRPLADIPGPSYRQLPSRGKGRERNELLLLILVIITVRHCFSSIKQLPGGLLSNFHWLLLID